MRWNRFFLVFGMLMSLGALALAQGGSASLRGAVIVGSGSPIPGVTVSIEGPGGGQVAVTDEHGKYTINGLSAGNYKVRISASGYGPFEVEVSLANGASQEVDAVLRMLPPPPVEAAPPAEAPTGAPEAPATGAGQSQSAEAPAQAPGAVPGEATTSQQESFSVKAPKGKAAVYGYVTDQSNAMIQSATAVATGSAGPVTVTANARGQYILNGLPPGQYKLSVSATGFAPFEADITLAKDQSLEIDAQLQPPTAREQVNVEASNAAQVQTETAHIEGTITEKEVLKTGLNGRNFTQLIALAPGVSNQTSQDEALVGVKGSVKYSVNGGRVEYNNFDVDGSDVLNAGLNGAESTLMVYPSLDAIQEVKVLTSNYGAMYGRTASGTVLVTTKSGTAQFHGSLYDFARNEAFNARNYFDRTTKAPLYRRQDFGGTIGGPLYIPGVFNTKKDRTFFFFSEEARLEKSPIGPGGEPGDFNQAVPTSAERGIGVTNCPSGTGTCGDFSDVCPVAANGGSPIIDRTLFPDCPAAAQSAGGNGVVTFAQNLVPINPTASTLLRTGLIPFANSPTGCNSSLAGTSNPVTGKANIPCYNAVISPSTYWREELFRIDHSFTESQSAKISFRYIHDSWDTTVATPQWGFVQNSFATVQNRLSGPGLSLVARLTNTISPSLLNEFVVSYVDSHITLANLNGPGANFINQALPSCSVTGGAACTNYLFLNNYNSTSPNLSYGGKPPGIVIAGTNADYGGSGFASDPSYMPWDHTNPTYGITDNVSKVVGKHTLQFGVQLLDARRSETNGAIGAATGDLQGILTFSNQNSLGTTGNAFADFLVGPGLPVCSQGCVFNPIKSYQQDSAQLKYYNDYRVAEPYLQDDWRASHRLTLNLGLRISLFGNYHEKNLNAFNWIQGQYSPAIASTVSIFQANGQTVNAGYFIDATTKKPIPINQSNPSQNLNPAITNGLVRCGTNGVPDSCMSSHLFNPAPRIGFAWDPKGDGKTSIRGGYGIFFEHGTAKDANTGSLEGSAPNVLTMTDPFPFSYQGIGLGGNNGTSPVAFPLDVTSIPGKTVWPYVQQWSLSVQRQLPGDMVATVAYVGSKGTHLPAELQVNQLAPPPTGPSGISQTGNPFNPGQPILAGDCAPQNQTNNINNVFFVVNGQEIHPSQPAWKNLVAACYGTTNPLNDSLYQGIPNPDTLRPFFGFHRILSLQDVADSQYNALQATLRRTRGPLTVGVSYTYSHSFDDSSDRSDASFVDSSDIKASWASSNFDERHLFSINYIYDVPKISRTVEQWLVDRGDDDTAGAAPKGQSDSTFLHLLLDGWQISGITVFQSGTPFSVINGGSNLGISVLDNAGVANGAGAGSYADVVSSPKLGLPVGVDKFNSQSIGPLLYNPGAFAAPQGLSFGDAGRNVLNNPHRLNFDMSLLKNFKIKESTNLEFRFEVFNVFNHTQFRIFDSSIGNAAQNTINCYGGGIGGAPYTAGGGFTILPGSTQPEHVDCTTGSSFLHPIDSHRPRTIQFGLKLSF